MRALGLVALLISAVAGCVRPPMDAPAMPVVTIRAGVKERIALMDRYRLHDEDRKRMMQRPRVWVEEVLDDEAPPPTEEAQQDEAPSEE